MQVTYQHQMSFGLSLLANYTWSRCSGDQHAPQNSQFTAGYRAQWLPGFGIRGRLRPLRCRRHRPVARRRHLRPAFRPRTPVWMPPCPRLRTSSWAGGRSTASTPSRAGSRPRSLAPLPQRPTSVAPPMSTGQNFYAGPHNFTQWLNPGAFAQPPAATTIGQVDYSPLGGEIQQVRGPHFNNLDSSILKNFNFTEVGVSAVPRRGLQHHQHAAFRAAGTVEFPGRQLQQHLGYKEQQPEQWSAHAAARSQDVFLRKAGPPFVRCIPTPHPA